MPSSKTRAPSTGDLEARLDAARKERDSLYERLREREEGERTLGNRPLSEVKKELDALVKEKKSLTHRLARRPSEDMVARLEMLERAQEEWEADRARLSQELLSSRAALARSSIAVTEMESLEIKRLLWRVVETCFKLRLRNSERMLMSESGALTA